MMNDKADKSNLPADEGPHHHPIDSCNPLISTSLRDLRLTYKNLTDENADPDGKNQKTRSDLK